MINAPEVKAQRASVLARAADGAVGRLQTAPHLGDGNPDIFATVGECLFWLVALADSLPRGDARRDADLILGLTLARNTVAHGEDATSATRLDLSRSGILGAGLLGTMVIGSPDELVWLPRDQIGYRTRGGKREPDRQRGYDAAVAGHEVLTTLRAALAILTTNPAA